MRRFKDRLGNAKASHNLAQFIWDYDRQPYNETKPFTTPQLRNGRQPTKNNDTTSALRRAKCYMSIHDETSVSLFPFALRLGEPLVTANATPTGDHERNA